MEGEKFKDKIILRSRQDTFSLTLGLSILIKKVKNKQGHQNKNSTASL